MSELELLRNEIDRVDEELAGLFVRRMEIVERIARFKNELGLSVCDPDREKEILSRRVSSFERDDLLPYYKAFLEELLTLSKDYQTKLGGKRA